MSKETLEERVDKLEHFVNALIGLHGIGVNIKLLSPDAKVPEYKSGLAAGCDLYAIEDCVVEPGKRVLVRTGIAIALPPGYEAQIRPRSGTALKHGITVVNTPGTVDADYRGEVGVPIINLSNKTYIIKQNDRVAQMVINHVEHAMFKVVNELDATERGDGGYGHTGK